MNMKILKWFFIVIISVVALVLLVAAFAPKNRVFTQSIEINRSPRVIFNHLNSLQNWETWSPFQEADPNMTSIFSGPESGVGNRQEWKSKKNGDGALEIIESINEHKVVFALDFGVEDIYQTWFTLERSPDFTTVTWVSKMDNLSYPMGRLMMTIFKSQMEKTFQKGMENLKRIVEEQPADCIVGDIEVVNYPPRKIVAIQSIANSEQIVSFLNQSFNDISKIIDGGKLTVIGSPLAIYEGDETTIEWGVTAAIPVNKSPNKLPEGMKFIELDATKAVCVIHTGSYQTASDSYYKLLDYITANELEISGNSWEEYLSPVSNEDPMQIQTKICFPVK
jgi:effector-binding domain-containing protein